MVSKRASADSDQHVGLPGSMPSRAASDDGFGQRGDILQAHVEPCPAIG